MKPPSLNRNAAFFFQGLIVLLGLVILFLMLWEPHLEGRNAHATTFEIYFSDPFLAYVYAGSIPFFVALQRAFSLLGNVRQHGAFSPATVITLRGIKRCGLALLGFVAGAAVIILVMGDGEDRPAGVFMCLLAATAVGLMTAIAAFLARALERRFATANG